MLDINSDKVHKFHRLCYDKENIQLWGDYMASVDTLKADIESLSDFALQDLFDFIGEIMTLNSLTLDRESLLRVLIGLIRHRSYGTSGYNVLKMIKT